ncbi:MAG: glycosyltransferase family 2 protein [Nitrospiraceae bacterium]|nr:glycosyltransferase family 2 protein [Nitrospiraceae bacterium]
MEMVVLVLKAYFIFVAFIMMIYAVRHYIFILNRMFGEQRIYYQDIIDSELPSVSVLVPMHNEEKMASNILDRLVTVNYPKEKLEIVPLDGNVYPSGKLEIIPINDHSTDQTSVILDKYAEKYSTIKPFHRNTGDRGKPSALNDVLKEAKGEIVVIFDADYLPPKGIIRDIAVSFSDPEVGAVMGRVIPINTGKNFLTRCLDLERTGGYQVDQQARYNLKLIPQYGGTVGGFRKDLIIELGSFDPNVLTEDTELTFKLFINGWKVVYANRVECYEESPEEWRVRARQIRRWSRGHSQVMFKYLIPLLKSKCLSFREKFDGSLLMFVYTVPFVLLTGLINAAILFFLGEMNIISNLIVFLFLGIYNTFGNFATFYQIGTGAVLDGASYRVRLLPFFIFNFLFNIWYTSLGFVDAIIDLFTKRRSVWQKTKRYGNGTVKV